MPETKAAASGSDDNKLLGALCYIPIMGISLLVALYILLTEKKSDKFLAFHAWQSLLLGAVCIVLFPVLFIGLGIVGVLLATVTMGFGTLIMPCVFGPLVLILFVGMLYLAWKAYQGEKVKLPIIGNFAEKQANK